MDEYFSEQLFALVQGVVKAEKALHDDNITPYLKMKMKTNSVDYKSKLPIIRVPRSSANRNKIPNVRVKSYRDDKYVASSEDAYDTLDFVHSNILDAQELIIIEGLKEGLEVKEIASELDVSVRQTNRLINGLRDRLQRRLRLMEYDDECSCDCDVHETATRGKVCKV